MQSKPLWEFIGFGTSFRYLQDVTPSHKINGEFKVLNNIDGLLKSLETMGLPVTARAANELRDIRTQLAQAESSAPVGPALAKKLGQAMKTLRPTLKAEAQGKLVFVVTEKRLDIAKLSSNIERLVRHGVFNALSTVAKYDLAEAGKCIAFERSTAAAFHLMRVTENCLRQYYLRTVKRNRLKPPLLWGPMVTHLRDLRKPPPKALLDNLDNMRQSFRNPTQHPDKVYDIEEVQDLFALCADVVNRMFTDAN